MERGFFAQINMNWMVAEELMELLGLFIIQSGFIPGLSSSSLKYWRVILSLRILVVSSAFNRRVDLMEFPHIKCNDRQLLSTATLAISPTG